MSITPVTKKSRPLGAKVALISAVSMGLIGGSVALAAPAEASTSDRGCTVDPLKPTTRWGSGWDSQQVDFRISVSCRGDKTVEIRQRRFEDDHGRRHEDFLGSSTFRESFGNRDRSITVHSFDRVANVDRRSHEEVFQVVSFRVRSGNSGNWSDWTSWEKSGVATVGN